MSEREKSRKSSCLADADGLLRSEHDVPAFLFAVCSWMRALPVPRGSQRRAERGWRRAAGCERAGGVGRHCKVFLALGLSISLPHE